MKPKQNRIDAGGAIRVAERFLGQLGITFSSGASADEREAELEGYKYYAVHVPAPTSTYRVFVDEYGRLALFSNPGSQIALSERAEPGEKSIRDKDALRVRATEIARILFPTETLRLEDLGFSSGHHGFKEDTAELRSLTEKGNFKWLVEVDGYVWRDRMYGVGGNVSSYDGTLLWAYIRQWAPPHDPPKLLLDESAARDAKRKHNPKSSEQYINAPMHLGFMLPHGRKTGRLAWCWNVSQLGIQGIDAENGDYLFTDMDARF